MATAALSAALTLTAAPSSSAASGCWYSGSEWWCNNVQGAAVYEPSETNGHPHADVVVGYMFEPELVPLPPRRRPLHRRTAPRPLGVHRGRQRRMGLHEGHVHLQRDGPVAHVLTVIRTLGGAATPGHLS
ncbi:hypothetical protein [Streptomyces shenzhenensis]|uniref:hypothetical protein n=1 Tax=Streptomyces shenzhenensis TaxID=943815 RepID=UPI001F16C406|nr:hypothetical protein [Streptomyces shenzhenensis]